MEQLKIVGKNINFYRTELDLTQDHLAEYLGISRANISYFEGGSREIPLKHLEALADLFGIELSDFFEKNVDKSSLKMAFAFRAEDHTQEDIKRIAEFKKIVKNYLQLSEMKERVA